MMLNRRRVFSMAVLCISILAAAARGAVLHVPGDYPTVQSAVAAATDGDEVLIGPGVYEEQVIIRADISLTGAGTGTTTILAPEFMAHTAHPFAYNAVIHVERPARAVAIRDLTVDGANRGRTDTVFTGIMFDGVGGVCERVEVARMTETPVSMALSGIGIYSYSQLGDGIALLTRDVVIREFQKAGFVCFGDGCLQTVERVTADASMVHSDAVVNGFELLVGSSGTLTDCISRRCWYDGDPRPGLTACGYILYYGYPWRLKDCRDEESQTCLYAIATDVEVIGGEWVGYPDRLEFNHGLAITTSPVVASARQDRGGAELGAPLLLSEGSAATEFPQADYNCAVRDAVVRGHHLEDSSGLTCYSNFILLGATIEGTTFADWDNSLRMIESDGGAVRGQARSCQILDSGTLAAIAATVAPFDARGNDWGDASGPYHPDTNPDGHGGRVSDNVIYAPWLAGNLAVLPTPLYISQADSAATGWSDELTVRYLGGAEEPLYGFSLDLTWDQSLLAGAVADVERPLEGPFASAGLFQVLPRPNGVRIDAALGGGGAGMTRGDLLRVRLRLDQTVDYTAVPITLDLRHARDNLNREIAGLTPNAGIVIADVVAPAVTEVRIKNFTLSHTDDYAKNGDQIALDAAVTDGDPLFGIPFIWGNLVQVLGLPGWQRPPDTYANGIASWDARPADLYPPDGVNPFSITVVDPAGNRADRGGTIIADNRPPQPVVGFTATPGHNLVHLHWDDPAATEPNLRQVTVRARTWGDYPRYTGPGPGYPPYPDLDRDAYTGLANDVDAVFPSDGSERDIVTFQAFAVDMVDHVSPAEPSGRGRSTNYFLGDVSGGGHPGYDGVVNIWDITRLGDTFALRFGEPGYDAECDVGPTDDGSEFGIPVPDGEIGLDDLMIFAMQFENDLRTPPGDGSAPAQLAWTREDDRAWSLRLLAPCPNLRGLRVTVSPVPGVALRARLGDLLDDGTTPAFLHAERAPGAFALCVLGRDAGVVGAGELLRVTASSPANLANVAVETRDTANRPLANTLAPDDAVTAVATPTSFKSYGAWPNPFNPATVIAFDLPVSEAVALSIFTLDGRRVATLVQAALPAGHHRLAWRGQDDAGRSLAAGTYMYRLEAGAEAATGKLNLIK